MKYQNLIEDNTPYAAIAGESELHPKFGGQLHPKVEEYRELAKTIEQTILHECAPWIAAAEGRNAYRGMMKKVDKYAKPDEIFFQKEVRIDRTAKDNPRAFTQAMNLALNEHGYNWIQRENALFVVGDKGEAMTYGEVFVIFPIGKFKFVWNNAMRDPWANYDEGQFHNYDPNTIAAIKQEVELDFEFKYQRYVSRHFGEDEPLEYEKWLEQQEDPQETLEFELEKVNKTFDESLFWEEAGQYYTDEDLDSALHSGNEVMIRVDSYYAINNKYWDAFITEKPTPNYSLGIGTDIED